MHTVVYPRLNKKDESSRKESGEEAPRKYALSSFGFAARFRAHGYAARLRINVSLLVV